MEEHSHCAQFAIGLEREQECSVGYVECAVRSHRQVQRPGEAVCESGSGLAAAENLGDLAGEARDEQAVADEGEVVETRPDIGKYGAVAGARVDPKDLSRGDLRGDDVTSESNFNATGTPRSPATRSGSPPSGSIRQMSLVPRAG